MLRKVIVLISFLGFVFLQMSEAEEEDNLAPVLPNVRFTGKAEAGREMRLPAASSGVLNQTFE